MAKKRRGLFDSDLPDDAPTTGEELMPGEDTLSGETGLEGENSSSNDRSLPPTVKTGTDVDTATDSDADSVSPPPRRNLPKTRQRRSILPSGLTPKEYLFVVEFLRHADEIKAAEATGARHPRAFANRCMGNPVVRQEIRDGMERKRLSAEMDAKRIVQELTKVALFNPKSLVDNDGNLRGLHELPDEVAVSIKRLRATMKVGTNKEGEQVRMKILEYVFHDKLDALKQLAQHLGLLKDGVNVNVLTIDWGALVGRKAVPSSDPIEKKITEMKLKALGASVASDGANAQSVQASNLSPGDQFARVLGEELLEDVEPSAEYTGRRDTAGPVQDRSATDGGEGTEVSPAPSPAPPPATNGGVTFKGGIPDNWPGRDGGESPKSSDQ